MSVTLLLWLAVMLCHIVLLALLSHGFVKLALGVAVLEILLIYVYARRPEV